LNDIAQCAALGKKSNSPSPAKGEMHSGQQLNYFVLHPAQRSKQTIGERSTGVSPLKRKTSYTDEKN
ncbi:MAG: hypothetical protein QM496_22605, partial [Verrucomicrobiota bacterium]